tara:strand:+ start:6398 stop:6889 length:492 start_codon:yes stop_codon:yes gene_type:complete
MKKINFLIILTIFLSFINNCSGYKPIFSSSNYNFSISDHSISGNKKIGNQIYSKLYSIVKLNNKDETSQKIEISINVSKEKTATIKNSAGKVLEYRINLNSEIVVKDYFSNAEILNQNFDYDSSFKVQDQHSETIKLENQIIENLVDKTYQDLLIRISESSVQ